MQLSHLSCGGTVDTEAIFPSCNKCGWSQKTVEKDNAKHEAKKNKPVAATWNIKRFKTEKEALLYRSEKADTVFLEANQLWMDVGTKPYDAKAYEKVKKLYQKAAQVAHDDDDLVTYAILDSMQDQIDRAAEDHKTSDVPKTRG